MRLFFFATALAATLVAAVLPSAVHAQIIPETTAQRHGLTRPWFTQVQMDRSHGRVRDVVLYEGIIYAQTDRAMIHAIDAETGQSLWAKQVGRPDHPSMTPDAFQDLLATVNGSRLYVVNRYNGEVLYETQVDGAPGAGPTLSGKRAYVPMVGGLVLAYRIEPMTDPLKELGKIKHDSTDDDILTDEEKQQKREKEIKEAEEERRQNIRVNQEYKPPLACQSAGRALVPARVTWHSPDEEFVTWATDRGYLNVGRIDRRMEDAFTIKYRLQTGQAIAAQPSYLPPDPKVVGDSGTIFTSSHDGYVYAILEKGGDLLWKFSCAEPMVEPAVVIDERVYAATQLGGMYCLDAKNGKQVWWSAGIMHFVAASKQRVYAADKIGRLAILDAKTGGRIDELPTETFPIKLTNTETDRIYLGTETGLLECLREVDQVKPIQYAASRKIVEEEKAKPALKVGPGSDENKDKPVAKKPAADRPPPAPRPAGPPKTPKAPAKKPPRPADDAGGGDFGGNAPPAGKATKTKMPTHSTKGKKGNGVGGQVPAGGEPNPFGGP